MPIISQVGSRSWKVRLAYGLIFLVLTIGALTMLYPFSLMVAGAFKSEADLAEFTPYPRFWVDDTILFQKYVESKHNADVSLAETAWGKAVGSWRKVSPPEPSPYLEDFLAWRKDSPWWWLGHSGHAGGVRILLPKNAREFRRAMDRRFGGDIQALNHQMGTSLRTWNSLLPPPPNPFRYPPAPDGLVGALLHWAAGRPVDDRILTNLDGHYWQKFLVPAYTSDIAKYNEAHGTRHASYQEILLPTRAPAGGLERTDWEKYVRVTIPLEFLRLWPDLRGAYQSFAAAKYSQGIGEYNGRHGTRYASFDELPFTGRLPSSRSEQVDWKDFLADANACPVEAIEIHGPRQSFEQFVAGRRGVPVETIAPLRLPVAQADWQDCQATRGALRWEFSTRNFRHVLEYIALHGRGIVNTLIYCSLAILTALLVNPVAAYALSRYKPPMTYTILLFCMTTMAFPGEVTMIPAFLLLKRFPLWPLLGGGAAFGVSLWLLSRFWPRLGEMLRVVLALTIGLAVGAFVIPITSGVWHVSLLNTFAALVLPGMANGYSIFLLKGFFDSLPRELYEAADIDGASEWRKFWTFTMGLSKPILAVIALGAFTGAYSAFMMALIIIPDQSMWTLMVWIFQLQSEAHQAVVYASLVIAAVPTLLVFVFCQSIIIRGIVVPTEK